ncbi:MAG: hypothetical protein NXH75_01695 [Halobacteriovoraceae bacterium]|nr:hypothetical protein [Halobacteriovoraceae bacterium]
MKWKTFFLLNLRWLNPRREGIHTINHKNIHKFFLSLSYAIIFVLLLFLMVLNKELIEWIKSFDQAYRIYLIFFMVEALIWLLYLAYRVLIYPLLTSFYKRYVELDVYLFSLLVLVEVLVKILFR